METGYSKDTNCPFPCKRKIDQNHVISMRNQTSLANPVLLPTYGWKGRMKNQTHSNMSQY